MEQLLDFRKEYRKHHKQYGRKLADRFARKQAILWIGYMAREVFVIVIIVGKRIFVGS